MIQEKSTQVLGLLRRSSFYILINKRNGMKRLVFVSLMIVLIISAFAYAHEDDDLHTTEAIIATDITSVDAVIASAAGTKAGVPVFIAENGMVPDDIKNALAEAGAETVILIGGPAVISEQSEQELKDLGYDVVRLWGIERTGTAVRAARHFWPEGGCALLVDDTKDSDIDAKRQLLAANKAARNGCSLIPVPAGTVPSEVLSLLEELEIDNVRYVGKHADRIKAKIALTEEIDDDEIETELEGEANEATKLVIVAAPSWKDTLGAAAQPNDNSIVKMVSSIEQVTEIAAFINNKGITDVFVVGKPQLSQEISDALEEQGITPLQVSGARASDVAKKVWRSHKEEWKERLEKAQEHRAGLKVKIRTKLQERLSDTEEFLNEEEVELEIEENAEAAAELKTKLDEVKAKVDAIKGALSADDTEKARKLISEIRNSYEQTKYRLRAKIKIDIQEKLEEEEQETDDIKDAVDSKISRIEARLSALDDKCQNVEDLLERAKVLKEKAADEREAGDNRAAALHLSQARKAIGIASSSAVLCKSGKTPERVSEIITKKIQVVEKVEGVKARVLERAQERREKIKEMEIEEKEMKTEEEMKKETAAAPEVHTIEMTTTGFKPRSLTIKAGDTVVFENKDRNRHWPASAVHPTHTVYPGSSINKCGTSEEENIFDACKGMERGEEYSFAFIEKGTWNYHDHLNSALTGEIVVE